MKTPEHQQEEEAPKGAFFVSSLDQTAIEIGEREGWDTDELKKQIHQQSAMMFG